MKYEISLLSSDSRYFWSGALKKALLWVVCQSSDIRTVLIASVTFSVDCSLCRDFSVKGFSTEVKYLDSW